MKKVLIREVVAVAIAFLASRSWGKMWCSLFQQEFKNISVEVILKLWLKI